MMATDDCLGATLSTVLDCRLGALNLRSARWRDVVFRRCRIDSFDAAAFAASIGIRTA